MRRLSADWTSSTRAIRSNSKRDTLKTCDRVLVLGASALGHQLGETAMGSIVEATCECGVNVGANVGGCRADHTYVCHFPCVYRSCKDLAQANLLDPTPTCPSCGTADIQLYCDPLVGTVGQRVTSWRRPNPNDELFREQQVVGLNPAAPIRLMHR